MQLAIKTLRVFVLPYPAQDTYVNCAPTVSEEEHDEDASHRDWDGICVRTER